MKFFFEQFGTAICVQQILRGVALCGDLQADGSALERCAHIGDALAVRMIETFCDA